MVKSGYHTTVSAAKHGIIRLQRIFHFLVARRKRRNDMSYRASGIRLKGAFVEKLDERLYGVSC